MRERPTTLFDRPLDAFTLLLRASGDIDQAAYATLLGTSPESLAIARCSRAAGPDMLGVPVCLSRPKGYRALFASKRNSIRSKVPSSDACETARLRPTSIDKQIASPNFAASGYVEFTNDSDGAYSSEAFIQGATIAGKYGQVLSNAVSQCIRMPWTGKEASWIIAWAWALLLSLGVIILTFGQIAQVTGNSLVDIFLALLKRTPVASWIGSSSPERKLSSNDSASTPSANSIALKDRSHAGTAAVWPEKDSLRIHWDVISDSDSDLDDELCTSGDLPSELQRERRRVARGQVLRRHHFVQLIPRFFPLLADHYTAGAVFDSLVEQSNPISIGSVVRAVHSTNIRSDSHNWATVPSGKNDMHAGLRERWSSHKL